MKEYVVFHISNSKFIEVDYKRLAGNKFTEFSLVENWKNEYRSISISSRTDCFEEKGITTILLS